MKIRHIQHVRNSLETAVQDKQRSELGENDCCWENLNPCSCIRTAALRKGLTVHVSAGKENQDNQ